jgi:hypothetical protein
MAGRLSGKQLSAEHTKFSPGAGCGKADSTPDRIIGSSQVHVDLTLTPVRGSVEIRPTPAV